MMGGGGIELPSDAMRSQIFSQCVRECSAGVFYIDGC